MKTTKERMEGIRKEWFPEHRAERHIFKDEAGNTIEHIRWANPSSWAFMVHYFIWGGMLTVCGDIGEAVYQWGSPVNLDFLAGCNPDYFAEKCRGIEGLPADANEWDEEKATDYMGELLEERDEDDPPERDKPSRAVRFDDENGWEALESQSAWIHWLEEHGDDLFSDPFELADIGDVVNLRVLGHLVGLKMAYEQLEGKQNGATTTT